MRELTNRTYTLDQLCTTREAADLIGISYWAVIKRIERGELPIVRYSPRLYMIPREYVDPLRGEGRRVPGRKPRNKESKSLVSESFVGTQHAPAPPPTRSVRASARRPATAPSLNKPDSN